MDKKVKEAVAYAVEEKASEGEEMTYADKEMVECFVSTVLESALPFPNNKDETFPESVLLDSVLACS